LGVALDTYIGGGTNINGELIVANTTDATSLSGGSIQTAGGLAVAKDVVVGGQVTSNGIILPTTGGTAANMNYFSTLNTSVALSNTTGSNYITVFCMRINTRVWITINGFQVTMSASGGVLTASPFNSTFCPSNLSVGVAQSPFLNGSINGTATSITMQLNNNGTFSWGTATGATFAASAIINVPPMDISFDIAVVE
jgi:hypothetical protein